MRKLVCHCDICGKEYMPYVDRVDLSDWSITANNMSGDVLVQSLDICRECQPNFIEQVKSLLTFRNAQG